jgi:single-stranded-DNA-specific exonuclease
MTNSRLPNQRWRIAIDRPELVAQLSDKIDLSPLMIQVAIERGIVTPEAARVYLQPESQQLPSPLAEFPDLAKSVELLKAAIANEEKIAICGDYDADGMTSTALLIRALRHLGADVDYAIPSRMKEGYGINNRIVEEFAEEGVGLILTVDNGISAIEPIQLAIDLGLNVIITDHHDLPETLPPADAILNPKLISPLSPYYGVAGVGVAYILAVATAADMGLLVDIESQLLELYTLGTIADLAPLVGVNRRWLKRGLRLLPKSQLVGIQALMQVAGVSDEQKNLKPDDIGFRLGPRINAIGRLADPQIVIELLTTEDMGIALERAMQCEQINQKRQYLCETIEKEAIDLIQKTPIPWQKLRVLAIAKAGWHHGVIGIVASRLVERYGVPVFISTYEEDEPEKMRGSARGTEEFEVFEALVYCDDLLGKYGGHKAAGGFSLPAANFRIFQQKLSEFAHKLLEPEHLKPLVKIDAQAKFSQLDSQLHEQIDSLQPWGIGNNFPVFWTPNVRIVEQKVLKGKHLKLFLAEDRENNPENTNESQIIEAIAWNWGGYAPLPYRADIAYQLKENHWNGNKTLQLEVIGARLPQNANNIQKATFKFKERTYACSFWESLAELRIRNEEGKVLVVRRGETTGLLGTSRETAKEVDVTQVYFQDLIETAFTVLARQTIKVSEGVATSTALQNRA